MAQGQQRAPAPGLGPLPRGDGRGGAVDIFVWGRLEVIRIVLTGRTVTNNEYNLPFTQLHLIKDDSAEYIKYKIRQQCFKLNKPVLKMF